MAFDHARQMWKAGVPLSDAWLHFAAQALRQEHESKPGFAGTVDQLVSVAGSTRDGKQILAALQTVGKAHLDHLESSRLLQDALREVLSGNGLVATGYNGGTTPVPIDANAFVEGSPDWENSKVHVNGTLYKRVRVTDPAAVTVKSVARTAKAEPARPLKPKKKPKNKTAGKALALPAAIPVASKPAGRSKASESIRAAIERLRQDDGGFADHTRKNSARMIRDHIGAAYEKGNGLSDPNLARHIRKVCGPKVVRRT